MDAWQLPEITGKRVGYARVSTEDQRLDMQLDALKAAGCSKIFRDQGVSGAKAARPGLDETLKVLEAGDALIVFKLDRLGRSVLHLADLLTRFRNESIYFVSLSEGINTVTPGGKLVYHIFAAVSEFQRDLIRENTVCGMQAARERGAKIGRPYALTECMILEAHRILEQDGLPLDFIAARCGVSQMTLRRSFRRLGL